MNIFLQLIIEFFKTGLFAVGGGLATIPFLQEMGKTFGWFTTEMLTTMIAISESTPGPMGINMATYVGYHIMGIPGALVTTLSLVAPSVIVICIIANMFNKFKNAKIVKEVFNGLRPAVVALIVAAVADIFIGSLFVTTGTDLLSFIKWNGMILYIIMVVISFKFPKTHPILYIVGAAIIGIVFKF